jgi:hypothetical protein
MTPSPRSYGERVGVRGFLNGPTRRESPSPEIRSAIFDLSPQAGRGEGGPAFAGTTVYALAIACENTTSISVPECGPVLMWNCARLASTRALVKERLTPELSEA